MGKDVNFDEEMGDSLHLPPDLAAEALVLESSASVAGRGSARDRPGAAAGVPDHGLLPAHPASSRAYIDFLGLRIHDSSGTFRDIQQQCSVKLKKRRWRDALPGLPLLNLSIRSRKRSRTRVHSKPVCKRLCCCSLVRQALERLVLKVLCIAYIYSLHYICGSNARPRRSNSQVTPTRSRSGDVRRNAQHQVGGVNSMLISASKHAGAGAGWLGPKCLDTSRPGSFWGSWPAQAPFPNCLRARYLRHLRNGLPMMEALYGRMAP